MTSHIKYNKEDKVVCICIPTYNAASTIADTIKSLICQSYRNIIIKVIDNCSNDNTIDIISKINDKRIKIYKSDKTIPAEDNFTRAINHGEGDYLALYHADDIYHNDIVKKQVAVLQKPGIGAVLTEAVIIDETGKCIGSINTSKYYDQKGNEYSAIDIIRSVLKYGNQLVCPSAMLRTDLYMNLIKRYRNDLFGSSSDLDVWLRVAKEYKVAVIPEMLIYYRISIQQGSFKINRLRTNRADIFRVLDYYIGSEIINTQLTEQDYRHYQWLKRSDRVIRAMNKMQKCELDGITDLCKDVITLDSFNAALHTKRGFLTLMIGIFIKISMFTGVYRYSGKLLVIARKVYNK